MTEPEARHSLGCVATPAVIVVLSMVLLMVLAVRCG